MANAIIPLIVIYTIAVTITAIALTFHWSSDADSAVGDAYLLGCLLVIPLWPVTMTYWAYYLVSRHRNQQWFESRPTQSAIDSRGKLLLQVEELRQSLGLVMTIPLLRTSGWTPETIHDAAQSMTGMDATLLGNAYRQQAAENDRLASFERPDSAEDLLLGDPRLSDRDQQSLWELVDELGDEAAKPMWDRFAWRPVETLAWKGRPIPSDLIESLSRDYSDAIEAVAQAARATALAGFISDSDVEWLMRPWLTVLGSLSAWEPAAIAPVPRAKRHQRTSAERRRTCSPPEPADLISKTRGRTRRKAGRLIGERVAAWLNETITPAAVYDHEIAHNLRDFGIFYDEKLHLLVYEGVLEPLPTYTHTELIKLGVEWLQESDAERLVKAIDLTRTLHRLLWPLGTMPDTIQSEQDEFDALIASISERQV
jgi:hypothetical protein